MKTKILMHKDVETAIVLQSENNIKIKEIVNKEHLPVGVYNDNQILMDKLAAIWSNDRIIPNDRQNLDAIINRLGTTVSDAYVKSLGVSLTDCYWFKEENSKLRWSDVNFYDNGFEDKDFSLKNNFLHPDLTTNGTLEKTWKSIDNIAYLLKKEKRNILTVNEAVVSDIAGYVGIPCTPYKMCNVNNELWSICPNIITDNSMEMVSILQIEHENISNTMYGLKFLNDNFQKEFKDMLLLHTLTHNTDGHERNIAVIRNADTLEYNGFAPAFDNGTCLGSYRIDEDGNISSIIHKTNEMKDMFSNRDEILDYIGNDIVNYNLPSFAELNIILKKYYENYNIPEDIYHIAEEELKDGYDAIIQRQLEIRRKEQEWER